MELYETNGEYFLFYPKLIKVKIKAFMGSLN